MATKNAPQNDDSNKEDVQQAQDSQEGGQLEQIQRLTVAGGICYEMTESSEGTHVKLSGPNIEETELPEKDVQNLGRFFGRLLRKLPREGAQASDGRGRVTNPDTDNRVGNKGGNQGRARST